MRERKRFARENEKRFSLRNLCLLTCDYDDDALLGLDEDPGLWWGWRACSGSLFAFVWLRSLSHRLKVLLRRLDLRKMCDDNGDNADGCCLILESDIRDKNVTRGLKLSCDKKATRVWELSRGFSQHVSNEVTITSSSAA